MATQARFNNNHKAFQLYSVVEKLPLQIECLTCFNQTFILGLSTGQILVYSINYNEKLIKVDVTLERSIKSITKKPIQQLMAITEFGLNILLALYDSQVHVFDLITYQHKTTIQKTKNAQVFSVFIPTATTTMPKSIQLCVVCKKKMHTFYMDPSVTKTEFMELYTDIDLNDTPKTIEFVKENLIMYSIRKEYFLYELPSKPMSIGGTSKELFNMGTRTLDPYCCRLSTNKAMAVCRDENRTILIDTRCAPVLTYPLVWTTSPNCLCNLGPFMIGLLPQSNTIEIITIEPDTVSVQTIDFQSGSLGSSSSAHNSSSSLQIPTPNAAQSSSFANSPSNFLLSSVASVANTVSSATSSLTSTATAVMSSGSSSSNVPNSERLRIISSSQTNSICYVITQNNVWCLIPVNVNDQLESLIKSHNYELAMSLINSYNIYIETTTASTSSSNTTTTTNPFISSEVFTAKINQNLILKIQNEFALDLYCQKQFIESMKRFELLQTDPTCIIAFIPGLLPDKFRMTLINYKDFKLPELAQANEQKVATDALIDYLQYKRKEILMDEYTVNKNDSQALQQISLYSLNEHKYINKSRKSILEIIDTTLLQCYLRTREQLVQNLLRRENNFFHLDESERLLKTHKKFVELITLYEKKQLHERALQLLIQESTNQQSQLYGLDPLIKYLKKLGSKNLDLIFKYSKPIFDKDPYTGLRVFINVEKQYQTDGDDEDDDETILLKSLNREKICEFLEIEITTRATGSAEVNEQFHHSNDELLFDVLIIYLEHIIYHWHDSTQYINNSLIGYYNKKLKFLKETEGNGGSILKINVKLLDFLRNTNEYDINYALSQFNSDSEERAILLGKSGKHLDAIRIYVEILNNSKKAEAYCENVYLNDKYQDNKNVYYYLLKVYLNLENDEIRIGLLTNLLNKHSNKIDSCSALDIIPADRIKCKNMIQFLESMLDSTVYKRRKLKIINHLTFCLNLQVHELRILKQQNKFYVQDENLCKLCNKRLGKSAIVRYPDGTIVHYGCCKDSNVF